MERLFEIDLKDYKETDKVFKRPSARAIILIKDKIALVYSKKEKYFKFPGGGIHADEDQKEALIREVREEVGMVVIPDSIREFGSVLRRQKGNVDEDTMFEQENFYYLCDVEDIIVSQELDEYEDEAGFELRIVTIDEAMAVNAAYETDDAFNRVMIKRELRVLGLIKDAVNAEKALYSDIASASEWESVKPVTKGWSYDKKFLIKTGRGERLLLRVSDIDKYDDKKKEYEIITKYAALGIPMSEPREFGTCNGGKSVYMLLSWVEGEDLESVLPRLSEKEQYSLGRQAGEILKKIHSISVDEEDRPKGTKKERKLMQLSKYEESALRISGDEVAVQYVKDNIDKIWSVPAVYQHGDFHPGNLIYRADGSIGVIDFNRWEVGDPYEEFYKLESFGTEVSVPYCIGQIDAYFDDNILEDFWVVNAVYVAHASLFSIKWAEQFGQKDIDGMVRRARQAFEDFDGFRTCIPKWYTDGYRKNM